MNVSVKQFGATLIVRRIVAVLLLLGLWQLVVALKIAPSMTPGVWDVVVSIWQVLASATFWEALAQTLTAALAGWAIAAVVGIVLGLIIGSLPPVDRVTSVLVDFGRSFPVIALMPVVIMLLGTNIRMEIVVVALSCLWPILVQTIYGSRRLEAAVADTVRVFRIPPLLRFRRVLLPAATPFIATGLRISASISILIAVSVEVISQTPGVGRQITFAQELQKWDVAFAYLFFAGLLGWGIATGLSKLEARVLKWNRLSDD